MTIIFRPPPAELSLNDQLRREAGYEVEGLARTLKRFSANPSIEVRFGEVFETATLYAKADIVLRDLATGEIELFEVKSGTSAKDEYINDLAFQCFAATECGQKVTRAHLITLDNSYVFDGELDPESLLRINDETEAVMDRIDAIGQQAKDALALIAGPEPKVALTDYCKPNKLDCLAIRRTFPDIPEYNVSHLFNAGSKKLNSLLANGILNISDIPSHFKLTDRESLIVEVERSGLPKIDIETIRGELGELKYPLNFLDYESFNPAVPKFVKTRPYQQMVFQYSLHTIDEFGGELKHSYHLSRNDGRHPTEEIAERLFEDLNGRVGTVLIWSEGFETKRNDEIGEMYQEFAAFFAELNGAVYDLRKIFSRRLYMHPGFRGRDSIKKVLPVLCQHLTYEGKPIADGLTASIKWFHMATGRCTAEESETIYRDLSDYCHLDTLAMVEIYKHLISL
ncbi:MAG: DUF2779 domain-containing protein [Acidobacteria bacterium]|nr:DUF2779 domain-containing protein [Acidobacteriota bacterium]